MNTQRSKCYLSQTLRTKSIFFLGDIFYSILTLRRRGKEKHINTNFHFQLGVNWKPNPMVLTLESMDKELKYPTNDHRINELQATSYMPKPRPNLESFYGPPWAANQPNLFRLSFSLSYFSFYLFGFELWCRLKLQAMFILILV